jgi:hypothetical protein
MQMTGDTVEYHAHELNETLAAVADPTAADPTAAGPVAGQAVVSPVPPVPPGEVAAGPKEDN